MLFPDTPYAMWVRGELADFLHLPETLRVEIIGGEIVVSRAPKHPHNSIIEDLGLPFRGMRYNDPEFPWRCFQGDGLDLIGIEDGCIPDLVIMDGSLAKDVGEHILVSDQVELVVEVTSKSNADQDRRPRAGARKPTKWQGYARAGIPYYLLVDRDPKVARVTLYSVPDERAGAYLQEESWGFGEPVVLPEHFGVAGINTAEWLCWDAA
ncbi:Uma2 family endonuclease [Actinocorallia lasiicapitis]